MGTLSLSIKIINFTYVIKIRLLNRNQPTRDGCNSRDKADGFCSLIPFLFLAGASTLRMTAFRGQHGTSKPRKAAASFPSFARQALQQIFCHLGFCILHCSKHDVVPRKAFRLSNINFSHLFS